MNLRPAFDDPRIDYSRNSYELEISCLEGCLYRFWKIVDKRIHSCQTATKQCKKKLRTLHSTWKTLDRIVTWFRGRKCINTCIGISSVWSNLHVFHVDRLPGDDDTEITFILMSEKSTIVLIRHPCPQVRLYADSFPRQTAYVCT